MPSPVLHDAQAPGRDLLLHSVVEQNDAVGDIFLDAITRELALAALASDDGGDALVLEPGEQAPQLGAQDRAVGKSREQGFDGIEHHTLGANGVYCVPEPNEQAFEVVLAALLDLRALDSNMVDRELPGCDQSFNIVPERGDIGGQILGALLEAHEDAGLVKSVGAVHQEGHGEQRFPGACGPAHQGRPPRWKPAQSNIV